MSFRKTNIKNKMRVITIKQPFASLIMHGYKKIETRGWIPKNPKLIEQIKEEGLLIHAGATQLKYDNKNGIKKECFDAMCKLDGFVQNYKELCPFGVIIGKVNLLGFKSADELLIKNELSNSEYAFGDYSENRFGWLLSNPIIFEEPIPAKGQLGLWNFDINDYNINSIAKF